MNELDEQLIEYCKAEEEFIKKIDKQEWVGLDTLDKKIKEFQEKYFEEHNIKLK